jgi:hypothetical protein
MKLLKRPILNTAPTKNNRRYTAEVLEVIKNQINENSSKNLGTLGYPEGMDVSLSNVAFKYSNAVIEKDVLYVDIETIHTPKGIELRKILEVDNDIRFRPGGAATLEGEMPVETHNLLNVPKHVSTDYKLITIAAITPDEDAVIF